MDYKLHKVQLIIAVVLSVIIYLLLLTMDILTMFLAVDIDLRLFMSLWFILFMILWFAWWDYRAIKKAPRIYYYGFNYQVELAAYKQIMNSKMAYSKKRYPTYVKWKEHIIEIAKNYRSDTEFDLCLENFMAYLNNERRILKDNMNAFMGLIVPMMASIVTFLSNPSNAGTIFVRNVTTEACIITTIISGVILLYDYGNNKINTEFIDDVLKICEDYKREKEYIDCKVNSLTEE